MFIFKIQIYHNLVATFKMYTKILTLVMMRMNLLVRLQKVLKKLEPKNAQDVGPWLEFPSNNVDHAITYLLPRVCFCLILL